MNTTVNRKLYWLLFLLIFFTGACAAVRPPEEKGAAYPEGKIAPGVPSDEDLFLLGTSYLGNAELNPDYFNARAAFDKLVKTYPHSKRRHTSELFIRLIDELQSLKARKSPEALNKLLRENEQMKKDLERLKRLEIETERRDRMLR